MIVFGAGFDQKRDGNFRIKGLLIQFLEILFHGEHQPISARRPDSAQLNTNCFTRPSSSVTPSDRW